MAGTDPNPTYLESADPTRLLTDFAVHTVAAGDYSPTWLHSLADDVTLEGSMMNGAVQGAEAALAIISYIRDVYEQSEKFKYAGPYGEDSFIEIYNAGVRGEPIGGAVEVTRNAVGQVQHIAANYRPRDTLFFLSRLLGEHFAGSPIGEHFASPDA
jgi:hypothetical protein